MRRPMSRLNAVVVLADRFRVQSGVDMRGDPMAAARLKEAGEVAKIELSGFSCKRSSAMLSLSG